MFVFTIPVADDFIRLSESGELPPLVTALKEFCKDQSIFFTDLLTSTTTKERQNHKELFFDCDTHWNDRGNAWAFEKLLPQLKIFATKKLFE